MTFILDLDHHPSMPGMAEETLDGRTMPTTSASTTLEEEPFQQVRPRRHRRHRPPASTSHVSAPGASKNYSNSTGDISGPLNGFTYAVSSGGSKGRKHKQGKSDEQRESEQVDRAVHAVDTFVRYLGSQLCSTTSFKGKEKEGEGRRSFARHIADVVRDVWPSIPSSVTDDAGTGDSEEGSNSARRADGGGAGAESWQSRSTKPMLPRRIVCLGLGSPTVSRSAQVQLALLIVLRSYLLLLEQEAVSISTLSKDESCNTHNGNPKESTTADKLAKPTIDCIAYDPVFTRQDRLLLSKYQIRTAGCASLSREKESSSADTRERDSAESSAAGIESYYTNIDLPTLLYMPHCDRELYEEVLSLNFPPDSPSSSSSVSGPPSPSDESSPPRRAKLTLLCNILANYGTYTRSLETCPSLNRLIPRFDVRELPNWEQGKKAAPLASRAEDEVVEFVKLWDRNALRDLGFHWL